jgi:hypothetical protein
MQALNEDQIQEMIKNFRYNDIVKFCSINIYYNKTCDENFWKRYVMFNYNIEYILNNHIDYFADNIIEYVYGYRDPDEIEGIEDLTLTDKWNFFLDKTPNKKWQELAYGLEYSKSIPMVTFHGPKPVKNNKILLFPYEYINDIVNEDFPTTSLIGDNINIIYDNYVKISVFDESKVNYANDFANVKLKIDYKGIKIDSDTKFMDIKINEKPLLDYLELASVID